MNITLRTAARQCSIITLLLASLLWQGGALAAGVTVHSLDGKTGGLGDHLDKSRWNLVMVWTTYCQFCREQYPMVSTFHDKYKAERAVVLGISLDGAGELEKVAQYRDKQQHSFPSVVADATQFGDLYEKATGESFTGTPTYLLFNPEGGLVAYLDAPTTLDVIERFIQQAR